MSYKDFDAARRERAREDDPKAEPVAFRLRGHEFLCVSTPPLGGILDLIEEENGPPALLFVGLRRLIRALIAADEDVAAFDAILNSKTDSIDLPELSELGFWLANEYTGRPTTPSSPSAELPLSDGGSSKPPIPGSPVEAIVQS